MQDSLSPIQSMGPPGHSLSCFHLSIPKRHIHPDPCLHSVKAVAKLFAGGREALVEIETLATHVEKPISSKLLQHLHDILFF